MMKNIFLLSIFLLLIPVSGHAQDFLFQPSGNQGGSSFSGAQNEDEGPSIINQYDKKYNTGANPIILNNSILPQGGYEIFLSRDPKLENDQLVLNFISPVAINGCLEITQPEIETRAGKPIFYIEIGNAQVNLKDNVQYAHRECHQAMQYAHATYILDKSELQKKGIKTLALQSSGGADFMDLEITENKLSLLPRTQIAFPTKDVAHKTDPLSHDFYPPNTVVLYTPGAVDDINIQPQLIKAAQNLRLYEGPFSEKNAPEGSKSQNFMYFIDGSGNFVRDLKTESQMQVAKISYDQEFTGPKGPYTKPRILDVYARLPGVLD